MRIPSGVTDQYIYFVAVDSADFTTRETGLSSFTVYRSRNGGAAAAMTTPTINETDATNMPGVYELLCDEDMTIDAGDDEQEMTFHITHAGMAAVTRAISIYRPKATPGNTLDVTATGAAGIDWSNIENPTTAVDLSGTDIQLVDTTTTNTDMRGTDSGATAAALAIAQTDLDTLTGTDGATLATAQALYAPAKAGDAMALTGGERTTLAAVIWNSLTSGMTTAGSIGKKLADWTIHSAADVWTAATRTLTAATNITSTGGTTVPQTGDSFARLGAAGAGLTDLGGMSTTMKGQVNTEADTAIADAALATAAALTTVDTVADAIKAKTDSLTFTKAGEVDANVRSLNGTTLLGDGSATPWGP